jgi:hypothetical protein
LCDVPKFKEELWTKIPDQRRSETGVIGGLGLLRRCG